MSTHEHFATAARDMSEVFGVEEIDDARARLSALRYPTGQRGDLRARACEEVVGLYPVMNRDGSDRPEYR